MKNVGIVFKVYKNATFYGFPRRVSKGKKRKYKKKLFLDSLSKNMEKNVEIFEKIFNKNSNNTFYLTKMTRFIASNFFII